jgi:hypothetical protein
MTKFGGALADTTLSLKGYAAVGVYFYIFFTIVFLAMWLYSKAEGFDSQDPFDYGIRQRRDVMRTDNGADDRSLAAKINDYVHGVHPHVAAAQATQAAAAAGAPPVAQQAAGAAAGAAAAAGAPAPAAAAAGQAAAQGAIQAAAATFVGGRERLVGNRGEAPEFYDGGQYNLEGGSKGGSVETTRPGETFRNRRGGRERFDDSKLLAG